MQSTKSQILAALKRRGRCSVDQLAVGLGLAPMTVRQHLATLERDELVASAEERQRLGRPHFVYFLTEKGEASFPWGFDRLAAHLVRAVAELESAEIAGLSAEQKTALLFDKMADRFVETHCQRFRGLALSDRVRAAAELLQQESGFAEWSRSSDGYEILDYNCFYRRLNGLQGEPCPWHARLLRGLLGYPVECRTAAPPSPQLCRFVVRTPGTRDEALAGRRSEASTLSALPLRPEQAARRSPIDAG